MFRITFILILALFCKDNYAQVLPPRMFADSAFAPFYYGVASGSPTANSVILWTHVTPASLNDSVILNWEVADDSLFANIVVNGVATADSMNDFTVKVKVTNLNANTVYYYHFTTNGISGRTGRTKTAPTGQTERVRCSVMSCSSIFSGYFNAYARLAERDNLDVLLHLGDHIYDFVDPDEEVRVSDPPQPNPGNLAEYRAQYKYYLLDPDLRAARQQHPWIVIWDNHDIKGNSGNDYEGSIRAFYEYVPVDVVDSSELQRIYHKVSYGSLLDIFLIDTDIYRNNDTLPNGAASMLGTVQRNWLLNELSASAATWKIIGNQKLFTSVTIPGGTTIPLSGWDNFDDERILLLNFLEQNNLKNNIVISGDAHLSFMMDLTTDPNGLYGKYDTLTGTGAVGIEMLGSSISRGNLDEATGISGSILDFIETATLNTNPNFIFADMVSHGYGILDIKQDSVVGEFYFSDILNESSAETFGGGAVCYNGANHWERKLFEEPVEVREQNDTMTSFTEPPVSDETTLSVIITPNPGDDQFIVELFNLRGNFAELHLCDLTGKEIVSRIIQVNGTSQSETIDMSAFHAGIYLLIVENNKQITHNRLVCIRGE